jgi:Fe-S cluster assembly iron-binding protein IscA
MEITEVAKGKLTEVLRNNPGKHLRIYVRGHG